MTTHKHTRNGCSGLCRMGHHAYCAGFCSCDCHARQSTVRLIGPDAKTRAGMRSACQQSTKGATRR